jgi:hypothetical protein
MDVLNFNVGRSWTSPIRSGLPLSDWLTTLDSH